MRSAARISRYLRQRSDRRSAAGGFRQVLQVREFRWLWIAGLQSLVGDQLGPRQRPTGYAVQSFFIGIGAVVASMLPWILARAGVSNSGQAIPDTVRLAFDVGAAVMLGAIGWTIIRTREYPPDVLLSFDDAQPVPDNRSGMLVTILQDIVAMPQAMRRLAWVQFFSWLALFSMWIYTTAAVAQIHFGATDPRSAAYNDGANWVGVLFGAYNGFGALAAVCIPFMVRRLGLRVSHLVNLWLGALSLLSFLFIRDPDWLLLSMLAMGFAWSSVLSLPYAMLSDSLPAQKMGLYMGLFNLFIVIPQVVAAGVLGSVLRAFFGGQPIYALALGGGCFIVAGLLTLRVRRMTA